MLLLTDVPAMVSTDNKIYQIRYSESFSGNIFTRVDNGPFTSLEDVFNQIFSNSLPNYKSCLVNIDASTVAILDLFQKCLKFLILTQGIYMECRVYYFGNCILASVDCVENLAFEMNGVICNLINVT